MSTPIESSSELDEILATLVTYVYDKVNGTERGGGVTEAKAAIEALITKRVVEELRTAFREFHKTQGFDARLDWYDERISELEGKK